MKYLAKEQVKLGFIGLGNMGSRIAKRLLDHGYQMSGYDRNLDKTKTLAAHGGIVAKSIRELASTVDVVISCLTNDEAVRSVYTGAGGVFVAVRPGTVVLEMSTISPDTSRDCTALAPVPVSNCWTSPSRAALRPPSKVL
jgi:3-hydroxyisobutyrate dehydrogenase